MREGNTWILERESVRSAMSESLVSDAAKAGWNGMRVAVVAAAVMVERNDRRDELSEEDGRRLSVVVV